MASRFCATFVLFILILTSDAASLSFAQPRRTCSHSCCVGALPMMQRSSRTSGATRRRTARRALPVTTSFTGRRPSWVRYVLWTCPWLRVVVAGMFEACSMVLRASGAVGSSIHRAVASFVSMVRFRGGCCRPLSSLVSLVLSTASLCSPMTAGLALRWRCLLSEHQLPDGLPVQATEGMLVLDAHG